MNLVEQYFPKKNNPDNLLADNMCLVKHFYGVSWEELNEMEIPEFLILNDYAQKQMQEQQAITNAMFKKGKGRR